MINRLHAASYERGRRLVAAGCPLDYMENLPRNLAAFRKPLYICQLGGYMESRILDFGGAGATVYLIGLGVGTDLPRGILISEWTFVAPWGHHISWDYDPREIVPASKHDLYASVFDSRLSAVLNDRRLLARGRPVEGLLCGWAFQSIPASFASGETVGAQFSLTADTGYTVALRIELAIDRSVALTRKARTTRREGRLFDKPDFVDRASQIPAEQQMRRASQAVAANSAAARAGGRKVADVVGQYARVTAAYTSWLAKRLEHGRLGWLGANARRVGRRPRASRKLRNDPSEKSCRTIDGGVLR
ncbi:MAG: hypothetical protein WBC04_03025 [Candidatus Acidiferrales bacterium]